MMFDCGAEEVHVRITAPPIKFPCFYGIDMATKNELAASRMSIPELCEYLGATSLGFLTIEGAVEAVGQDKERFCLACFNGDYKIPVPSDLRKNACDQPEVGEMAAVSASGQFCLFDA
jgi:amidophosphoribosyltransferase